ncbi:MAG: hypothetical protein IPG81_27175 [Sandaracinaceae bacterium]|nr:hypothetical protein [Sandaracinaceae bacterium]
MDADVDAGPSDAGYDAGDRRLGHARRGQHDRVRIDERDCLPPACGGFFVQAVNQAETPCADGSMAAQCYVAELDWAPSGLAWQTRRAVSAAGGLLLDARMEQRQLGNAGVFGVLRWTVRGSVSGACAWIRLRCCPSTRWRARRCRASSTPASTSGRPR